MTVGKVSLRCAVNISNYETVAVEVEATTFEESRAVMQDCLKQLGVGERSTRERVESYTDRVFGQKAMDRSTGGKRREVRDDPTKA